MGDHLNSPPSFLSMFPHKVETCALLLLPALKLLESCARRPPSKLISYEDHALQTRSTAEVFKPSVTEPTLHLRPSSIVATTCGSCIITLIDECC